MADYTLQYTGAEVDTAVSQELATADYVVERGTSDGWTYKKWNSGQCEAWKRENVSFDTTTSLSGGLYGVADGSVIQVTLPTGAFTSIIIVDVSILGSRAYLLTAQVTSYSATNGTFGWAPISSFSNSFTDRQAMYHVVGRWK